ncbi:hypothetical protein TVAG_400890 [Trichomonas vaginalis G3]|uniref:Uncharacterized protein n=1 Tax=Trichomonas vaginalis (strain ATCC PRA-98 / G3) TaxID=412133 RepID=A2E3J7_TRIV3|nr:cysteine proteinases family [Trichomonas vaginalis G3]EAY12763.1 hypothetical protein TVAG_400890 [Trichomonas vaginalis G3]KAI5539682.1 cysteine proteinases family [Trichomonas vaginalis G3]|eukprot:XP_001324986.1 hypothetical protein [Trichomonas vaginalis G3]
MILVKIFYLLPDHISSLFSIVYSITRNDKVTNYEKEIFLEVSIFPHTDLQKQLDYLQSPKDSNDEDKPIYELTTIPRLLFISISRTEYNADQQGESHKSITTPKHLIIQSQTYRIFTIIMKRFNSLSRKYFCLIDFTPEADTPTWYSFRDEESKFIVDESEVFDTSKMAGICGVTFVGYIKIQ